MGGEPFLFEHEKRKRFKLQLSMHHDPIMFDWQKLAEIKELKEYFEADFEGFKKCIEKHIQSLQKIDADELDKLALLRVLEVTNGCTQWGFRRQDEQCLSVEQTRECMRQVIGFIQNKQIDLPSGEQIHFAPSIEALIEEGRELYQAAFKKKHCGKRERVFCLLHCPVCCLRSPPFAGRDGASRTRI